jgi:hypothetical protein
MIRHSLSGPGGDTRENGEECEVRVRLTDRQSSFYWYLYLQDE